MNTLQRLLSNTLLAFVGNVIVKASSSILFILIGRLIGPNEAGVYNLGVTYFTILFGLSAWGLHELLVREVAPRREESGRYLVNYLAIRLLLAGAAYGGLLLFLRLNLPYSPEAKAVISVLSLALFPEAIFSLCQALFAAHERLGVPTAAAFVNSAVKLGAGLWILQRGGNALDVAWVMPVGSGLSLLIFVPALVRLFGQVRQRAAARLSVAFSLSQLAYTPGFVVIHLFSLLDFQTDTLLISFFLDETHVGWYGAAQTVMLAFWMMPVAIRTAVYPLMARYHRQDRAKLAVLYQKTLQYLLVGVLPLATGISLLAGPIIHLIFDASFEPAVPALRWTIWAIVFAFLNVPSARLMLVYDRQTAAGWLTGLSMTLNVALNLVMIPRYGIVGAAAARVLATGFFFAIIYLYVQRNIMQAQLLSLLPRPLLAALLMGTAVWLLREQSLIWPVLAGAAVYGLAGIALGLVPASDRSYWRNLVRAGERLI